MKRRLLIVILLDVILFLACIGLKAQTVYESSTSGTGQTAAQVAAQIDDSTDNYMAYDDTAAFAAVIRDDINDSITGRFNSAGDLKDIVWMLDDSTVFGELGTGAGHAGDTALIDASFNGYGYIFIPEDTGILSQVIVNVPTGDTLNGSVVMNDTLWSTTDCDTLLTINVGAGDTTITTFDISKIPEGNFGWFEMSNVVVTKKPIKFRVTPVGYIKRD